MKITMKIGIEKSTFHTDMFYFYILPNKNRENSSIIFSLEKNSAFYIQDVKDIFNRSVIKIMKEEICTLDKKNKKEIIISK
jgi:hypothetical protein